MTWEWVQWKSNDILFDFVTFKSFIIQFKSVIVLQSF